MNQGVAPALLPKNQLGRAVNVTVRGTFVKTRPHFRKQSIASWPVPDANNPFLNGTGLWQDGCYYKPDNGTERLRAVVSGRLFDFTIGPTITVGELTIPGDPNPSTPLRAWIWQTEKWTVWNDGQSIPIFTDASASVRSGQIFPSINETTTTADFKIPNLGGTNVVINLAAVPGLAVGTTITVFSAGQFTVVSIAGNNATCINITAQPIGATVPSGAAVSWPSPVVPGATPLGALPPGRMGVYGMGRNWICLVDGKQFIASDLVGGSSGTVANDYRDAVLQVTENQYLAGGGNFTVPGSVGEIQAMIFSATLDASLGQGPLQVFTNNTVFSCQTPVDRLTWQDVTNPILTESLIAFGGEGQNCTVNVNGDIMFRSIDGFRSLILARREFSTWGNVPISREVEPILNRDSPDLLQYGSAIVFDNRLLFTTMPVLTANQGIYSQGLIALNFDAISTLRGKAPAVYDGLWTGLNVLKLIYGKFLGVDRCFAFTLNTISNQIELYEILKSSDSANLDNDLFQVTQVFETPILFNDSNSQQRNYKRLTDGEIYVDQLPAGQTITFKVEYKPDNYPCWTLWNQWTECVGSDGTASLPQFRPRMGLGQPSATDCDPTTNRPMREGYYFQLRITIIGDCVVTGGRFGAVTAPEPQFAQPSCS